MLKSQDIVLLLKLLSQIETLSEWSQNQLAVHLCISVSEINAGLKRLYQSGLLMQVEQTKKSTAPSPKQLYLPMSKACEEFLIFGLKYVFPVQLGEYTRGIATAYAAPILKKHIAIGKEPIPVWPFAEGDQRGLALKPLYPSVPKSLTTYPDPCFYDLLTLVDAIRQGRARERNIAIKLLKERLPNNDTG